MADQRDGAQRGDRNPEMTTRRAVNAERRAARRSAYRAAELGHLRIVEDPAPLALPLESDRARRRVTYRQIALGIVIVLGLLALIGLAGMGAR